MLVPAIDHLASCVRRQDRPLALWFHFCGLQFVHESPPEATPMRDALRDYIFCSTIASEIQKITFMLQKQVRPLARDYWFAVCYICA